MTYAKAGERTIYGGIWTDCAARAYNSVSERISQYEREGKQAPEHLLNGRHNIYVTVALFSR